MADTTLTNGNFWSTVFNTTIAAINDTDSVLVKAASGTTDTIITAALLRAYLQKGITPSIGTDGYWYIGGVLIKDASGNPIQISAEGKTPTIAMKTIGGVKGLYLTYKGSSAEDTDWTLLVTATDLMFTFDDLTDAQKQSFLTYFTDAIANCNTATTNANTATANCETAASEATTAAANANAATDKANTAATAATTAATSANNATASANTAAQTANTAATSANNATASANTAIRNVNNTLAQLVTQGANSVWVFMVRKHGNSDPDAYKWYGSQSNIKAIGKHSRMAWAKDNDNFTICANGRISADGQGNALAIDGTNGDLIMMYDCTMYHYENTVTDATDGDLDIIGVGLTPNILFGKSAEPLPSCGFFADRAVVAKMDGDTTAVNHCFYNTSVQGTYTSPSAKFKEVYETDGGGKATQYISTLQSIIYSQSKNTDSKNGNGWYGLYYLCYQLWIETMFLELGSVKHTSLDTGFGAGMTVMDVADSSTFYGDTIYGNSGVKIILSDGSVKAHAGLTSQPFKSSSSAGVIYANDAVVGNSHYGLQKEIEPQRIADLIVKNGWESKIGVSTNIFYFDDSGNLVLSSDGSINLSTGVGMTANKRYYVVRNVTNCDGLSDGVMTLIVNAYQKMNFIDGACYADGTLLTGGCAIYKLSMPIYRGVSFLNGVFTQMFGFHYRIHTDASGNYSNDAVYQPDYTLLPIIASNDSSQCYGAESSTLQLEKGMKVASVISFGDYWAGSCKPSVSLFYYPSGGGDRRVCETSYVWKSSCWGVGTNGKPDKGW
jgi:hypothetical protein